MVVLVALVSACSAPLAPAPRVEAHASAASDLAERLSTCLSNAWLRSGPHLSPESLARYNHFAAICYSKYARET